MGPPPYKCGADDCENGRTYSSRKALKLHFLYHVVPPENAQKCTKCSKYFPSAAQLKKHVGDKHPTHKWKCACGKAFWHNKSLKSHIAKSKDGGHRPEE